MSKDAEAHYERLLSVGYTPKVAEKFIRKIYAASFRDMLQERDNEPEQEQDTQASGDEMEVKVETVEALAKEETTPHLDQKVLSKEGMGIVRNIGSRFITIEWLGEIGKDRVALRTFDAGVQKGDIQLIPTIRTARKNHE